MTEYAPLEIGRRILVWLVILLGCLFAWSLFLRLLRGFVALWVGL